jgi:hypothetical protein
VHLVGFILRICHDARSHERKIRKPSSTPLRIVYHPRLLEAILLRTNLLAIFFIGNLNFKHNYDITDGDAVWWLSYGVNFVL